MRTVHLTSSTLLLFLILLRQMVQQVTSAFVYNYPPAFYSQHCYLGQLTAGSTETFDCTFEQAQKNVIRWAAALSQISKPADNDIMFKATWSLLGANPYTGSSFIVKISTAAPLKLGYFMLLIKDQTANVYIDLIYFSGSPGNPLDNSDNAIRVFSFDSSILSTQFSSTVGLTLIPLISYYNLFLTPMFPNNPVSQYDFTFNFEALAIDATTIQCRMTIQPIVTMDKFLGSVIIVDTLKIQLQDDAANIDINLVSTRFSYTNFMIGPSSLTSLILADYAPSFGPSFNQKCFLGLSRLQYTQTMSFDYTFGGSLSSFEQTIDQANAPSYAGTFFCYGYDWACPQGLASYFDSIAFTCTIKGACLMPVPAIWTYTNKCPWCRQLVCQQCQASTRQQCYSCNADKFAVLDPDTNQCACDVGYYPVYLAVTNSSGLWGGQSTTLEDCKLNCSYFMIGCLDGFCTSLTYCIQCQVARYLSFTDSTHQNCVKCNTAIAACNQCVDAAFCTVCKTGYFLKNNYDSLNTTLHISTTCQLCNSSLPHCTQCNSPIACDSCQAGYQITLLNLCNCSPLLSNLTNCQSCLTPIACAVCNIGFFVHPGSNLCNPCSNLHFKCQTCINITNCSQCGVQYYLDNTVVPGYLLCSLCSDNMPFCDACTGKFFCSECLDGYGFLTVRQCKLCSDLLSVPGCDQCTTIGNPCTSCTSSGVLINNSCYYCDIQIPHCMTCQINPSIVALECVQCEMGYYSDITTHPFTQTCQLCSSSINMCQSCANSTHCTKCKIPNELGPTSLCDRCLPDYFYYGGVCVKQAGCMNYVYVNGIQICLACQQALHFIYHPQTYSCVCDYGYQQFNQINYPKTCVSRCGDGILVSENQQCDDSNVIEYDGCDRNCKVERNFQCSFTSPSDCILYMNFYSFSFAYVYRVQSQNKAILHFNLQPKQIGLEGMAWSKFMNFNFSSKAVSNPSQLKYKYSSETGQLQVQVPYEEQIEGIIIQTVLTFDPQIVVSIPSQITLVSKLNGINFPLIFQSQSLLSTYRNVSVITLVISILLLVQFYIGSYVSKMIGIETIMVFQIFYLVRITVNKEYSSLFSSLNVLQYSTTGYSNSQLIVTDATGIDSENSSIPAQFQAIGLQKYFISNINVALIPVFLSLLVYLCSLVRTYRQRSKYLKNKSQYAKDNYTKFRRTSQFIYDHFLFPYLIMLNFIVFFSAMINFGIKQFQSSAYSSSSVPSSSYSPSVQSSHFLSSSSSSSQSSSSQSSSSQSSPSSFTNSSIQKIAIQSSFLQFFTLFITYFLYCKQIFQSYQNYMKTISKQQITLSLYQNLERDQNYNDRPNYHPFYVFIYLIYYLLVSFSIVSNVVLNDFNYGLEIVILLSFGYLILIWYWEPYSKDIASHNIFLKINHGTILVYLSICEVINRGAKMLNTQTYIILIYVIVVLLFVVLAGGYIRIYIEYQYRKKLEYSSNTSRKQSQTIEQEQEQGGIQKNHEGEKDEVTKINRKLTRKQKIIRNNPFIYHKPHQHDMNNLHSKNPQNKSFYDYIITQQDRSLNNQSDFNQMLLNQSENNNKNGNGNSGTNKASKGNKGKKETML